MLLGKLAAVALILSVAGFARLDMTFISVAYASNQGVRKNDVIPSSLRTELATQFPGARIELVDAPHWTTQSPAASIDSVRVTGETALGQVEFFVQSHDDQGPRQSYGWQTFAAYVPARIMVRRILPGEQIQAADFATQDLNVASGPAHDFRGVLMTSDEDVSRLEARQTLLEGQPLLSSAVERIPDVRRGDSVRVQLVSAGMILSTEATASEPAYLNGTVRVLTIKNKRELSGTLVSPGVVEVRL